MKYAIVESGGKQYRVVEGGVLEVDRLQVETGVNVKLEQVLLLADGENISVGTPLVKNTTIWTTVVEHFRGPKVNIFNYSPKKRIRVKIGHRQNYTRLYVEQIGGSELVKKEPAKVEKAVEAKSEKAGPKNKPAAPSTKEKVEKTVKAETEPAKVKKPANATPAKKAPAKTAATASPKAKTPAKKTTPAKAESKTSPKGKPTPKKPAAK
jgi:large subunit ribosomal protein L21